MNLLIPSFYRLLKQSVGGNGRDLIEPEPEKSGEECDQNSHGQPEMPRCCGESPHQGSTAPRKHCGPPAFPHDPLQLPRERSPSHGRSRHVGGDDSVKIVYKRQDSLLNPFRLGTATPALFQVGGDIGRLSRSEPAVHVCEQLVFGGMPVFFKPPRKQRFKHESLPLASECRAATTEQRLPH